MSEHHELKTHEFRTQGGGGTIYYYCVCGGWSGKVSHLRHTAVLDKFLEEHLT